MKLYLNYEDYSLIYTLQQTDEDTFEDLTKYFLAEFRKRTPSIKLRIEEITLTHSITNQPFKGTDLVRKRLKDGDDINVILQIRSSNQISEELLKAEELFQKENYKGALAIFLEILKTDPNNFKSLKGVSQIYFNAKKNKEALDYTMKALNVSKNFQLLQRLGDIYMRQKNYEKASEIYRSMLQMTKDEMEIQDIYTLIAKVLYETGNIDESSQLVLTIISSNEQKNIEHLPSYLHFARILIDKKQYEKAIQILVRSIIKKPDDDEIRGLLAKSLDSENAFDLVEEQVRQSAPSLAFLATIIKDYGAVMGCASLMKKALELQPDSVTYALSYLHSQEILVQYQTGFTSAKQFLRNNIELKVGGVTCGNILGVIEGIKSLSSSKGENIEIPSIQPSSQPNSKDQTLTNDQLELLAYFCTIVKISYLSGALCLIPKLNQLIEPLRVDQNLHLTSIRNENAYQSCIEKTMPFISFPFEKDEKTFYICGDSHCIPLAWQKIQFQNETYRLTPLLATGLKIWHLREESTFYPKKQFQNLMKTVPKGSKVIFLFGEIDCRESFLVSVNKCRYENMIEAALVTIKIYIKALLNLKKSKNLQIFVHPINPVLNETRPIVKAFNELLETELRNVPEINFLNFFDQLLTEDQESLKKEFELDGAHLSPTYLPLLQTSLQKFESSS